MLHWSMNRHSFACTLDQFTLFFQCYDESELLSLPNVTWTCINVMNSHIHSIHSIGVIVGMRYFLSKSIIINKHFVFIISGMCKYVWWHLWYSWVMSHECAINYNIGKIEKYKLDRSRYTGSFENHMNCDRTCFVHQLEIKVLRK